MVLRATPAPGSAASWAGADCTGDSCEVVVDHDMTVTAVFTRGYVTLRLTVIGRGVVTESGDGLSACKAACTYTLPLGEELSLRGAGSQDGTAPLEWTGCEVWDDGTCTVTMDADRTVTAVFAATLRVRVAGDGEGRVTADGRDCAGGCRFRPGAPVVLRADYDAKSTDLAWSGAPCAGRRCEIRVDGSTEVTATFTRRMHDLSIEVEGSGGVDRCGPAGSCVLEVPDGERVDLTAVDDPGGYIGDSGEVFLGWSGCEPASERTCSVTVTGPTTVVARFGPPTVTVVVQTTGVGGTLTAGGVSCTPSCRLQVPKGAPVEVAASYDEGTTTVDWNQHCRGASCTVPAREGLVVTAAFAPVIVDEVGGDPDVNLRRGPDRSDRPGGGGSPPEIPTPTPTPTPTPMPTAVPSPAAPAPEPPVVTDPATPEDPS
jgi:hypothetical protein